MYKINFLNTKSLLFSLRRINFLSKEVYEEVDYNFPNFHELIDIKKDLKNRGNQKYAIQVVPLIIIM